MCVHMCTYHICMIIETCFMPMQVTLLMSNEHLIVEHSCIALSTWFLFYRYEEISLMLSIHVLAMLSLVVTALAGGDQTLCKEIRQHIQDGYISCKLSQYFHVCVVLIVVDCFSSFKHACSSK